MQGLIARVVGAAAIGVQEDRIADQARGRSLACGCVAKILQVVAVLCQVGGCTHVERAQAVVVIGGLPTRQHVAGVIEPNQIVIRAGAVGDRQPVEGVAAARISDGGGDDRFVRVPHAVAIAVPDEGDRHGRDERLGLGAIRRADGAIGVGVGVEPHRAAEVAKGARRRLVAEVGVDEHVARSQHDGNRGQVVVDRAGGAKVVRVARLRVTVGAGGHADFIDALRQPIEDVRAVGGRGGGEVARCIGSVQDAIAVVVLAQRDGHAAQARFARILFAVAVGIYPDAVTNRAGTGVAGDVTYRRPVVAEVGRQVRCAEAENHTGLVEGGADPILVIGRIGRQAGRHGSRINLDGVGRGGQRVKEVPAFAVGHGGGQQRGARRVVESHRHVGNPRLAGILHAVAVLIQPDAIAQAPGALVAEILRQIAGGIIGQNDRRSSVNLDVGINRLGQARWHA